MAKKKTVNIISQKQIFSTQVLGMVALGLALMSMVGVKASLGLWAIGLGGVSVWNAMRTKDYSWLFLGVSAILIGVTAIWWYANLVMAAPTL